jgi:hypothetical protein
VGENLEKPSRLKTMWFTRNEGLDTRGKKDVLKVGTGTSGTGGSGVNGGCSRWPNFFFF